MAEMINIKCPYCSALLKVQEQPGLENASITCPVCNRKTLFRDFKKIGNSSTDEDETITSNRKKKKVVDEDETITNNSGFLAIGCLIMPNGRTEQLHMGINTIGRESRSTLAEIHFPDVHKTKKSSRNHAKIEVVKQSNGTCKHILYNWQNRTPTYVNGDMVDQGDRIILHNGDSLRFGDVPVRFIIADDEETLT